MATHSSILAWRIPWTEEPGGLQSKGSQESDMTERLNQIHSREALVGADTGTSRMRVRCGRLYLRETPHCKAPPSRPPSPPLTLEQE